MSDPLPPPELPPPDSSAPLTHTEVQTLAARGALTVMVRGMLVRIVGLLGNIVIARVLLPREFGLVALGNSIMIIGDFIASGGLSAALIARPGDVPKADLKTLMGFQLAIMTTLTIGLLLTSLAFGTVLLIAAIMVGSLMIDTTRVANGIVLERRLDYKPLVRAEVAETIAWNVWAVGTVLAGAGVWGIATAQIFRALVGTVFINLGGPVGLLTPTFSWRRSRGLLGLGIKFQGVALIQLVKEQGLTIAVALVGSLAVLGLWGIVTRLVLIIGVLLESLWRVSFPAVSRLLETDVATAPIIARGLRVGSTLTGVLITPLIGASPALIYVLFGPHWQGSVNAVPASCFAIMIAAAPSSICFGFFMASGRANLMLMMTAVDGVVMWGIGLTLIPSLGVEGLSFGVLASALVDVVFLERGLRGDLGISLLRLTGLQSVAVAGCSIPAWLAAEALGRNVLSVLAAGALGVCGYLLVLAILQRSLLDDVVRTTERALRNRRGTAATA